MSRFSPRAMELPHGDAAARPPPTPALAAPAVIPVDFTVVKKSRLGGGRVGMALFDARGGLVFRVAAACGGGSALLDAAGNALVTVRCNEGELLAFRGNSWEQGEMIFNAKAVSASANQKEIHVFIPTRSTFDNPKPSYRLIGSQFGRSCTIITGNSIVAQTSLLYKLKKVVYSRSKFRVTIYPGNDHVLIMAMIVTFFTEK